MTARVKHPEEDEFCDWTGPGGSLCNAIEWACVPVHEVLEEIKPHIPKHYQDAEQGLYPAPSPVWPQYEALGKAGLCFAVTARCKGHLAAYGVFMIFPNMHYSSVIQGVDDGVFVLPQYRKHALGKQIFEKTSEYLKRMGATRFLSNQHDPRMQRLLLRMGFKETEKTYMKELN